MPTTDSLMACGPGVERLADEVAERFPGRRVLVLSSDFPGGAERLRREIEEIANGAFDIVIGTAARRQGHNFPGLTLVGVIDADVGLSSGDPRAAERTFQMLQQVTGRAGREREARHGPGANLAAGPSGDQSHSVGRCGTVLRRGDRAAPPCRSAAVRAAGRPHRFWQRDRASAEGHARALVRAAHAVPDTGAGGSPAMGPCRKKMTCVLLGPAEAPIAVVRGRHRFRLLLKAPRSADLQGFLRAMLAAAALSGAACAFEIDVDPMNFM